MRAMVLLLSLLLVMPGYTMGEDEEKKIPAKEVKKMDEADEKKAIKDGEKCFNRGDFQEVVVSYEKAEEINPGNLETRYNHLTSMLKAKKLAKCRKI